MNTCLRQRNVSVENVEYVVAGRGGFVCFVEVVLHLDGETARVGLPVAVVSENESDGRIVELRIYYSSWPLTGRHALRPPVLQPDPKLRERCRGRLPDCPLGRRRRCDRVGV